MELAQSTETYGSSALEVFASDRGLSATFPATIDLADFTKATHAPNGYFPPGLHVSWQTEAEGLLQPDGDVADEYAGIITDATNWPKDSAGAYRTTGIIHVAIVAGHCDLYELKLEVDPSAAARADAIEAGVSYRQYG